MPRQRAYIPAVTLLSLFEPADIERISIVRVRQADGTTAFDWAAILSVKTEAGDTVDVGGSSGRTASGRVNTVPVKGSLIAAIIEAANADSGLVAGDPV